MGTAIDAHCTGCHSDLRASGVLPVPLSILSTGFSPTDSEIIPQIGHHVLR